MSIATTVAEEKRGLANLSLVPDPVSAYLAQLVDAWLAADPSRTARDLAKAAGISGAQLSNIRHGSRGAGKKSLRGLADAMGMTWPEIELAANAWARAHPAPKAKSLSPLPPHLITALEIMRGRALPISLDEVERLYRSGKLQRNLTVGGWIDEIQRLDREADVEADSSRIRKFQP